MEDHIAYQEYLREQKEKQKSDGEIKLPEIDDTELSRTLLQTKFLSTHNSYITVKQQGGILSRDLVLEQLNGLEHYPICIEIDLKKKKDGKLHIDHYTSKTSLSDSNEDEFTGNFLDELNFLYKHLNKKKRTFPLVISVDTTQFKGYSNNLVERCMSDLAYDVYNCDFNNKDKGKKTFFDYNNYFLKCLLDKLNNYARNNPYYTTFLTELNKTDILANFAKSLSPAAFIKHYLGIGETTDIFKYLEELITTFKNGCMSVNTPLKDLMNTVLIRYRTTGSFFNLQGKYTKILHKGQVHLNGALNTSSRCLNDVEKSIKGILCRPLSILYEHNLNEKDKNKIQRAYPIFVVNETKKDMDDGKLKCNQTSAYKKLSMSIMKLNYNIDLNHINMLAFNWHDICKEELDKLIEAFTKAYKSFLELLPPPIPKKNVPVSRSSSLPQVSAVPNLSPKRRSSVPAGVNGGSRKRRNLKKKKKKSKRHRRKTRKL